MGKLKSFIAPATKLYQHLPVLHAIKLGERPPPINVEIDLSNRCSLGCEWCHFAYTHTRGPLAGKQAGPANAISGGDLMDLALAESILDQLSEVGVKSITWTGGGEPTLHPQFNAIAGYANYKRLEQGLYTHGGHINPERARILKKQFTWVFISLDECTPEAYKKSKGVDRFDRALEGISNLVNAEGMATIGVGFLLHKENWRDTHHMVKLARSLGVDYVQFRPTILSEKEAPGEVVENLNWLTNAMAHLNAYQKDSFVIADLERFAMYRDWDGHGYSTCYWSGLQTVITPNGKVWRCTNKREHPGALLGDLSQESFSELWARSGGSCGVDSECRLMCRGHVANLSLQPMMATTPHGNFI